MNFQYMPISEQNKEKTFRKKLFPEGNILVGRSGNYVSLKINACPLLQLSTYLTKIENHT